MQGYISINQTRLPGNCLNTYTTSNYCFYAYIQIDLISCKKSSWLYFVEHTLEKTDNHHGIFVLKVAICN